MDLATAKNSGLRPIAVTWGFRDEDVLKELGAEYIAKEPEDILSLLKIFNKNKIIQLHHA